MPVDFRKEENMKQSKFVILYEKLSRDDDTDSELNSIRNQKLLLEDYAAKNGMTNYIHITDDGVSGLWFDDRPGYVQMMEEVESDNVSAVCVKDITRLSRDYLRVGMCMEQLRINGLRYAGNALPNSKRFSKKSMRIVPSESCPINATKPCLPTMARNRTLSKKR